MALLNIFWNGNHCGKLETTERKGIIFTYDEEWNIPLSISLPIRKTAFSEAECLPFFSGLLPDGQIRMQIADAKHISYTSVFKLLQIYGGEIAGAISLCEDKPDTEESTYSSISEAEIAQLIRNSATTPIILHEKSRLSLAGAQQKVPMHYENNQWLLPLGNSPSSVIIKPSGTYTVNEFLSTKLAEKCNFSVPEMKLTKFEDQDALVIKRFDRENLKRIHQEDFCQALGIMPEKKYEDEGGPGFKACIYLIENNSSDPIMDTEAFKKMAIFNFIIGNCDAHGKNFSFMMPDNGKIRLAPFYDITATAIYPELSRNTAMKYGNEKRLDRITYQDILKIGNDMKQKIEELSEIIPPALEELESLAYENGIICTYMKLKNDILERNRALMKSRTY